MITIKDKKKCSGCTACYAICSVSAIKMESDEEGFLYPFVDKQICVECHKCEYVCPIQNHKELSNDLKKTFTAKNINSQDRVISSSGGVFIALARKVLQSNGIVFGCALDENFLAHHILISSESELPNIVGSKYMQSRLDNIFNIIRNNLKLEKKVLFCGTTCQVAGLKAFLEKEYSNLICIDFICLGVPSPKIWSDYLNAFFNVQDIKKINFKDKTNGWHKFSLRITNKSRGDFVKIGAKTLFFAGYFKGLYVRPCCSECVFKSDNNIISDITISDCWGAEHIAPELDDDKGLSSVVCHTQSGLDLFYSISKELIFKEAELEDIQLYNNGYCKSRSSGVLRSRFWNDYHKKGAKKSFKKYCKPEETNIVIRGIRKIKRIIQG